MLRKIRDACTNLFRSQPAEQETPAFVNMHFEPESKYNDEAKLNPSEQENLKYLNKCTNENLAELRKLYQDAGGVKPTAQQLDDEIAKNRIWFYWYYVKTGLADLTNLLYLPFQILFSNEGISSFVRIWRANATVPVEVGWSIGAPTSVVDVASYTLVFSPRVEAAKKTLAYVHGKSWGDGFRETRDELLNHPLKTLWSAAKKTFHKTVTLSFNLTSIMTEIISIAANIFTLPWVVAWGLILGILYFGEQFMQIYIDPSYHLGVDFWRNLKNRPYIVREIFEGHVTLGFQVLTQFASLVLVPYPFIYFVAVASDEALGFWPPAIIVAALAGWQTMCALYPISYDYYMSHKENLGKILQEELSPYIQQKMREENPELTQAEINAETVNIIKAFTQFLRQNLQAKHGRLYLLKTDYASIPPILYRAVVGGYFGFEVMTPLTDSQPLLIGIVGAAIGAITFGALLYRGEENRQMFKLLDEHLQMLDEKTAHKEELTRREKIAEISGTVIPVISAMALAMATAGTGDKITSSLLLKTLIALAAGDRAANAARLTIPMVKMTMRQLLVPRKPLLPDSSADMPEELKFIEDRAAVQRFTPFWERHLAIQRGMQNADAVELDDLKDLKGINASAMSREMKMGSVV